jgi:hypothetical protein
LEKTNESPRSDYSIGQLRDMITGKTVEPVTPAEKDTPAASGEENAEATTVPDSGTEETQVEEHSERGTERDAEGKFKQSPGVQKRIDKAVKAQRDAERERDELKAKLGNQESRPAKETAPPVETKAEAKAKPEAKDFETYETYVEALTDWKLEARETQRNQEQAERTARESQQKIADSHAGRIEKAKERYQDWDDVMTAANSMPITREIHAAIVESDFGPDIAYHLATHPDDVKRIAALPPLRQIAELGKLEVQFEKPANAATHNKEPQKKPLPKPAATVGGSAGAKNPDLADPDIDMATFKRIARAQLHRR